MQHLYPRKIHPAACSSHSAVKSVKVRSMPAWQALHLTFHVEMFSYKNLDCGFLFQKMIGCAFLWLSPAPKLTGATMSFMSCSRTGRSATEPRSSPVAWGPMLLCAQMCLDPNKGALCHLKPGKCNKRFNIIQRDFKNCTRQQYAADPNNLKTLMTSGI